MAKKSKVPSIYKESKEARKNRVREEAGRFRSRVEKPKTVYSRKNYNSRNEAD